MWRNRPLTYKYPYVYLDGLYLKRSWGGEVRNIAILVAVGVDEFGFRDIVGICEGAKEDKGSWFNFLRHLRQRGLNGVGLVISDKCIGLVKSIHDVYPDADWQWCAVHFMRDVFTAVPRQRAKLAAAMLKAIYAQESREAAMAKADAVACKLDEMRLSKAAQIVRNGVNDTLTFYDYPSEHWIRIRTNNMLERMIHEIKRRTRVVGNFPDGDSALMLVGARLRHIAGTTWSTARYLDMKKLEELKKEKQELEASVG